MPTPSSSLLVIFGAGGHGRVVADAALAMGCWSRIVATDRDPRRCSGELLPGVPLLAPAEALAVGAEVHIAIGAADARAVESAALASHALVAVLHPRAAVSPHAVLGAGCFVAAQAVVAPSAQLGACVIVNHGAVVDHDVRIGDYTHIAPQAALGGGAHVGRGVLVGAGALVLPGLRLADGVVVGAGAVVRESILEPGTYAGVPARRVR